MAIRSIPHRPHRIGNWLRLWVGLSGGFSDQCCASTTLSIFHAGMKGRARIQPEAGTTLALLMALGELHGRNLASAFMRSRVHNRTGDRGGKPIRLAWPWALPPVLPEEPGALSPKNRRRQTGCQNYIQIRKRDSFGRGTRDGRVNRDVPETTMSKTLLALAAATSITVSVLAAPPAQARCTGCAAGAGVAASVATGFMVGSAIANTFFGVSIGTILAMRRLRRRLQSS
jgi:hypothetical protein